MSVEIESLAGHAPLVEQLAGWHVDEFGHHYADAVWNLDIARREFDAMATTTTDDMTWVAFAGSARTTEDVLGSVSLVATDDLDGFDHLTPWLASLFIRPDARGRGIGTTLVSCAVEAAAARGHEYVYLFTPGHEGYYLERGWRRLAEVEQHGGRAVVMTRSTSPRAARRAVSSQWYTNPDTRGAYSYVRVGGHPRDRDTLAGPIMRGLWFAGEATSRAYPATMHGAWFSGERAADQALAELSNDHERASRRVLVVGVGLAGIAAARRLLENRRDVTVLEAGERAGGRVATDTTLGVPLPLGAAWLHGHIGHPLAPFVTSQPEHWGYDATFAVGHGEVGEHDRSLAEQAHERLMAAFAAASADRPVADIVAATLPTLTELTPIARAVVLSWLRSEIENLFAAPMSDFSARDGFEPYMGEGDDCLITSSLAAAVDALVTGLDVRYAHRVEHLHYDEIDGVWSTDTGERAGAVIVTVPIPAIKSGRLRFTPDLPAAVVEALDHLGAGPVTKLFATYDTQWWPAQRPLRIAGDSPVLLAVELTALTGVPTLGWMAVGADAIAIESMSEDEQCRLVDDIARRSGLSAWGAPAPRDHASDRTNG